MKCAEKLFANTQSKKLNKVSSLERRVVSSTKSSMFGTQRVCLFLDKCDNMMGDSPLYALNMFYYQWLTKKLL